MKRLRDLDPATPLQQRAQELLSAVDPVSESHDRMARVRRRLDEPRAGTARARRMPALAIAALIGLFGASAFAAVRMFVLQAPDPEPAARVEQSSRTPVRKPVAATRAEVEEPATPMPATPMPATLIEAQNAQLDQGEASTQRKPALRPRAKPQTSARPDEANDADKATHDSELVHRAVKALRREHNPKLAVRLLEQDRIRNPHGPLAEEALSLRIEAALQLGDPRARALAEQYIARYPSGRYLAIARRALGDAKR